MLSANRGGKVYNRPTATRRGMAVPRKGSGETWSSFRQNSG